MRLLFSLLFALKSEVIHGYWIQAVIILSDPALSNNTVGANARIHHARQFTKQLPFPVQEWWSVKALPCPVKRKYYALSRGNDRGCAMVRNGSR